MFLLLYFYRNISLVIGVRFKCLICDTFIMPEDLVDLKKYEDLSNNESKVVEILEKNKEKAFTLNELAELFYSREYHNLKSYKEILLKFGITSSENLSLHFVLENLLKKNMILKIFAKGKEYYYIK